MICICVIVIGKYKISFRLGEREMEIVREKKTNGERESQRVREKHMQREHNKC